MVYTASVTLSAIGTLWLSMCLCLLLNPAHVAAAEDTTFDDVALERLPPELEADGWQLLSRNDVPATSFSLENTSDAATATSAPRQELRIEANQSNALMFRALSDKEQRAKVLSWSWRVDQAPPANSLRHVDNDDRPLAVYVGFSVNPKHLGLWARFKRSLVSRFSGLPKGQIMTYVWGGTDPRGSTFDNPYIPNISRMHVLRSGAQTLGVWVDERIVLHTDFTRAFGYPALLPTFIAVSADTEDSQTLSIARLKNLRFE